MSLYGYLFGSQVLWRIPRATTISDINASLKTKYPSRVGIKIAQDGRFDKMFKTGDSGEAGIQFTCGGATLGDHRLSGATPSSTEIRAALWLPCVQRLLEQDSSGPNEHLSSAVAHRVPLPELYTPHRMRKIDSKLPNTRARALELLELDSHVLEMVGRWCGNEAVHWVVSEANAMVGWSP